MPTTPPPAFLAELKAELPTSTATQRSQWASTIVEQQLDIPALATLLHAPQPIATRFCWLLSELGELSPNTLHKALPYLLNLSNTITHINIKPAFANYWRIAGVPEQNEAQAIHLLFGWLQAPSTSVTIKGRAMLVLQTLCSKHPDLRGELLQTLQQQQHLHSPNFAKRVAKVLQALEATTHP